jgi:dTDP-4-amino-4,6-dideoxygalactose transaminase
MHYLQRIWASSWVTNDGEHLKLLEKELSDHLGVPEVVVVSSGTMALQLAIRALGLSGSVITTPFTFATTTNLLAWEGLKPVFADIEHDGYCIDPADVERKITEDTSAILAVHVYGDPCDVEALAVVAKKHGLRLIYDAAHAFDVEYDGRSLLDYGDASAMSFHATKVFNTMEGGAVVAGGRAVSQAVKDMRNHGIISEERVVAPGINAKMSEVLAAVGLCNLEDIDEKIASRRKIYEAYKEQLADVPGISFQKLRASKYNYAYMPILFDRRERRDATHDVLVAQGIKPRKYFYPLTVDFDYLKVDDPAGFYGIPVAVDIAERILCLPLFPTLQQEDFERIIRIVRSIDV